MIWPTSASAGLAERTHRQTGWGCLPYLQGLVIDSEDSIGTSGSSTTGALNVIVPVLPRISNHNDFDPLRLHPKVNLQFIGPDQLIPPADLIILPGSKKHRADLAWLQAQAGRKPSLNTCDTAARCWASVAVFKCWASALDDPDGWKASPAVPTVWDCWP